MIKLSELSPAYQTGVRQERQRNIFPGILVGAAKESQHLQSHETQVGNLAVFLGENINNFLGTDIVDTALVADTGNLHDWGKLHPRQTRGVNIEHYRISQLLVTENRAPTLAKILGRHNFGSLLDQEPKSLEQMLLVYADVRSRTGIDCKGERIRVYKSLSECRNEIGDKLLESGYTRRQINSGFNKLIRFEKILQELGINLNNLKDLPDRYLCTHIAPYQVKKPNVGVVDQARLADFERKLNEIGVVTLRQDFEQKVVNLRKIIRQAARGNKEQTSLLALINPRELHRWVKVMHQETSRAVDSKLNAEIKTLMEFAASENGIHEQRTTILKVVGEEAKTLNASQKDIAIQSSRKIFTGSTDDDVSYHAAEAYGKLTATLDDERLDKIIGSLTQATLNGSEDSYGCTALLVLFKQLPLERRQHCLETIIEVYRNQSAILMTKGIKTLDLLAYLMSQSTRFKELLLPDAKEQMPLGTAFRYAYVLKNSGQDTSDELLALKTSTNNPILKGFISSLIDEDKVVDLKVEDILPSLASDDLMVRLAALRCAGFIKLPESSEKTKLLLDSLLSVINQDSNPTVKIYSLLALTRYNILPQLDGEQTGYMAGKMWEVFFNNPFARRYIAYFLGRIYGTRSDFNSFGQDIAKARNVTRETNDDNLLFETGRFFIGMLALINDPDKQQETVKDAFKTILELHQSHRKIFDLLMQKYVTRLIQSPALSSEKSNFYLWGTMTRKMLASAPADSFSRLIALRTLDKHCQERKPTLSNPDALLLDTVGDFGLSVPEMDTYVITRTKIDRTFASPNTYPLNVAKDFRLDSPDHYLEIANLLIDRDIWYGINADDLLKDKYYQLGDFRLYIPHIVFIEGKLENYPGLKEKMSLFSKVKVVVLPEH